MLLAGSHVNVTLSFLLYNFSYSINQRQPLLWKKDFLLSYSPNLSHSLTLSWQQTADDSTILIAILIVLALDSSTHLQLDLSVFSCSLDPMPKCIPRPCRQLLITGYLLSQRHQTSLLQPISFLQSHPLHRIFGRRYTFGF